MDDNQILKTTFTNKLAKLIKFQNTPREAKILGKIELNTSKESILSFSSYIILTISNAWPLRDRDRNLKDRNVFQTALKNSECIVVG